jgi:hypothetical protein
MVQSILKVKISKIWTQIDDRVDLCYTDGQIKQEPQVCGGKSSWEKQ